MTRKFLLRTESLGLVGGMATRPQLDKMEHEELTDYVVVVCLGETEAELPPAQKLMGMLGVDEPIATAQITDAVEIEHLDAETIAYYLAGHVSPERCKAIEDGAKLTAEEKKHVVNVATKREFESGTFGAVEYFRVTDSKGRSVYFSARSNSDCGSWAPSSGHEGPMPKMPYEQDAQEQLEDGSFVSFCIYG